MKSISIDNLFGQAIASRDCGNHNLAINILKKIVKIDNSQVNAHVVLGGIYLKIGQFRKAAHVFRFATKLKPNSEMASLGLFHSLIYLGHFEAAVIEGQRFLLQNNSKAYRSVVNELNRFVPHKRIKGSVLDIGI